MKPKTNLEFQYDQFKSGKIPLQNFLESLPEETERNFEIYLTKLVNEIKNIELELLDILNANSKLIEETFLHKILYPAFYGLCIYYKHMKDTTKIGLLIDQYRMKFKDKIMYNHMEAMFLIERGKNEDIKRAINKAEKAATKSNNAGVFHNCAWIIAFLLEKDTNVKNLYLEKGLYYIGKSIELDPTYAKFYCTYGRLLAQKNEYNKAIESIKKAIDFEDSHRVDYPIRISEYQSYLFKIELLKFSNKIKKAKEEIETQQKQIQSTKVDLEKHVEKIYEKLKQNIDKIDSEAKTLIDETKSQILEFLGFFAALLSISLGSIQIINHQPFDKALQLILILAGSLICSFSGFSLLIHGKIYLFRNFLVFLLGLIMIALVLFVLPYFL